MITLTVDNLTPGMIVASPIVTKRGQTISKPGEKLTPQLIAKLSFYKIDVVTVEGQASAPVDTEAVAKKSNPKPDDKKAEPQNTNKLDKPKEESRVSDQITYSQRLKQSSHFQKFQSDYALNIANLKEHFNSIIAGGNADCCTDLLEQCEALFKSKTTLELFDMLANMRNLEDPIYSHSLNVGLIARCIGKWLHLSKSDLNTLTLAGLLHDIGKTQIPEDILNKPGKYTDEEFATMKTHPLLGKKILNGKGFDSRILAATLQHHERSDGSGYPRGLMEDEIDDFAAIIAIADVYDAMTSARAHRDPLCSFQVINQFEKDGLNKYHTKYVLTFLEHMANTYNNSRVMLNTAKTGRVVYINKSDLSRPVIQLDSGEIISLADNQHKDLYIKSIL
ncbi:MAG: HD-GYP domain-containing protein [Pseudobutyrivibrio sp.]|uniref:HD-GYP domain-containing protein n=1 Tax=Pseudobutyrivibrio sp. TaxID=2014367 RepID=UPI001B29E429|nr:HD-GYP domain-containing protein [Pseudobutyrivibrio sp.]MBO5617854.1 HD-GYP domain-containing protein [Pseudobutyrivibrio sp.]MBO6283922.1 HD-GYP domain-containing protein [Pseudobutyrivibrio sp.]MBP3262393.1 HD-GYP domain-containing protein [Pseudobutyrivibrio sp.]